METNSQKQYLMVINSFSTGITLHFDGDTRDSFRPGKDSLVRPSNDWRAIQRIF